MKMELEDGIWRLIIRWGMTKREMKKRLIIVIFFFTLLKYNAYQCVTENIKIIIQVIMKCMKLKLWHEVHETETLFCVLYSMAQNCQLRPIVKQIRITATVSWIAPAYVHIAYCNKHASLIVRLRCAVDWRLSELCRFESMTTKSRYIYKANLSFMKVGLLP